MSPSSAYVIAGAGLAGAKAAETLREEGFGGPVVLIRTYVVFPSSILRLTCGDASGRGYGFWLREPDRDG